ncbi:glycerophosphoryl diester phosphodiesterase membrane domain-containing protein [Streptomyces sp. N2-109]|uniref:Glycerophosphoryl diester phosphodiesterase membrane domain-containing protein n=1 Tax=Streptomyces gossypii TaxID=2883101 RepID=A0ABT2JTW6_9ACTN|nr:glycerophosphoryl diester phosphodiesterase membrane domain-containing protein [Streptomyces gossypii]MCT2591332.1 glycerophosphoryl diester phosphodiesterase membrane domain-containing protein [Streptomyces gossypii]
MSDSPGWASPGSNPSDPADGSEGRPGPAPQQGPQAPQAQPPRNWAPQQPPAGGGPGWGAAPPPPPPPGQPGPPGWNQWNHAWNQPPVAQPGVIPLRPLAVGEILDGAVSSARDHWRTALGIALGVAIMIQIASTAATGIWLRNNSGLEALQDDPNPSTEELTDALQGTASSAGVELLATLVGTVVATAMLTIVVSRAVLGRAITLGEAWRESRPQLPRLLGLTLLVLLIVVGAFAVGLAPGLVIALAGAPTAGSLLAVLGGLVGLVAGVWLWVRYCLAAPALMLEKQTVTGALRRSAKLVTKSWWRIFGIQILAVLLVTVVGFIVQIPASLVAGLVEGDGVDSVLSGPEFSVSWTYLIILGIGAVIASTVTLPLSAGITALLYMDQRIRREALDLELARAAGTGDGTPASSPHPAPGS